MNVDSIIFSDSYRMPLKHPVSGAVIETTDGRPMWIDVLRSDAPAIKALQARYRNEALRNPGARVTAEQIDERVTEQLVAGTVGWLLEGSAGLIEYSQAAARALYRDPTKGWIAEQVDRAMHAREEYLVGEP